MKTQKTMQEDMKTPILADYEENGKVVRVLVTEELFIKRTVVAVVEDTELKDVCKELNIEWL